MFGRSIMYTDQYVLYISDLHEAGCMPQVYNGIFMCVE
jgi:hypothetical protein